MSRPRARPLPARRFAVLCFGLSKPRVHKQPWHVADGMARGLAELGHDVLVVTDAPEPPTGSGCTTTVVDRMFDGRRPSAAVAAAVTAFAPERVFLLLGAVRLARLAALDLGRPTSLVMASPRLARDEFLRLPLASLWREGRWLALPLLDALAPGRVLAAGLRRSGADDIVYLSDAAQRRYVAAGLPAGRRLVPQVSMVVPTAPPAGAVPTVAFLGPALDLRGADLALQAFEQAVAAGLDARLLMLLREDAPDGSTARMVRRCRLSPARERIDCETARLDRAGLRRRLAGVAAYLLPFRVPISEVPLVVIEAGLSGRPVIALEAPGVSEIVRKFDGLLAADAAGLPAALVEACRRAPRPPPDPSPWTSWADAVAAMLDRQPSAAPPAMVALVGVDGSGKTCIAAGLARRLALAGIPHRQVWSRFRNYLSKPLLALARITGHNRKEVVDGTRVGYHDFAGARCWPGRSSPCRSSTPSSTSGCASAARRRHDPGRPLRSTTRWSTSPSTPAWTRWCSGAGRRSSRGCCRAAASPCVRRAAGRRWWRAAARCAGRRQFRPAPGALSAARERFGLPVIRNDGTLEEAIEALADRASPSRGCRDVR